jgi:hypothetical protein
MLNFTMLFAGGGVLACATGIWTLVAGWRFSQKAQQAEGVVIGVVERRDGGGRSTWSGGTWVDGTWTGGGSGARVPMSIYYPVVRFRAADGREVEARTRMGTSFKRVREGEPVTVLYDPDDPTHAQLERSGGLVIVLGVAQCLLGAAFCIMVFLFCSSLGGFGSVGG